MSPKSKEQFALKIATWCAMFPMLLGTVSFLLWLVFQDTVLILTGFFALYAAMILFFIGLVSIIFYFVRRPKSDITYKPLILLALLLFNFPLAYLYLTIGKATLETYSIHIHNESEYKVEKVQIFLNGQELAHLDTVPPHNIVQIKFSNSGEGSLLYRMIINNQIKHGTVFGYVTSGMGGLAHIRISKDFEISITDSTGTKNQSNYSGFFESIKQ